MHTVRAGFERGGHAEMGAVRIFDTHEYTQRYVKAFELDLIPYGTGRARSTFRASASCPAVR